MLVEGPLQSEQSGVNAVDVRTTVAERFGMGTVDTVGTSSQLVSLPTRFL